MLTFSRSESTLLLLGDILVFFLALWVTLLLRYVEVPSEQLFGTHLVPFMFLSVAWAVVFFISGLYDKHTDWVKQGLLSTILHAQAVNIFLAALFFFLIPSFGLTPKTILLIYLLVSSVFLLVWRVYLFALITPSVRERAIVLGEGEEVEELVREINKNPRYGFEVVRIFGDAALGDPSSFEVRFVSLLAQERISILIAHARDERIMPLLPKLFALTFAQRNVRFIDLADLYENIFARVPISLLKHDWFLTYATRSPHLLYDALKRGIDIVAGVILTVVLALLLPFVWIAVKLDDGGAVFIEQRRKGRWNTTIRVYKLRTMRANEHGVWLGESANTVTRVGRVLRKLSLDEFPQILNILRGEMSLIGPRNDIAELADRLEKEIPFYAIRTLIKPGITGWAQTHQRYTPGSISPQSVEETRMRLAYDLYYIKHRSLLLDINIALRTVKTLLSRFGVSARAT